MYTGDGATAKNNAAWPGVEMTAPSATDGCQQTDLYKYVVPDNLAKGAKVIFNDGGSQQYPGSRQPGLDYNGGIVKWDGSSAALAAVECTIPVPVESVSISGDGVRDGKLSLKSGASAQLTATVKPDDATDRKVTWTSSDSSVANVMGTGVVTAGSKAGKATVTATAGGKSASVEVTVEAVGKQPMTVWYKPDSSWKTVKANYRVHSTPQSAVHGAELKAACGGWYKLTVPDTKGAEVSIAFTNGSKWDSNGGKNYIGSGTVMAVSDGRISFKAPDCPVVKPMTVWYKPDSSWKTVKANYRVYSAVQKTGNGVVLEKSCGGWYSLTVPDTEGARVSIAFTNGSKWDSNGGKNYIGAGDSMAVSGGQVVSDVTPNCTINAK